MHDKNKDTKRFTDLTKYYLNGYFFWQYLQEPDLELDQKSMVELFCKNNLLVFVLDGFLFIWETE